SPFQVSNIGNVKAVSGGYMHSLALKTDGTVWTWGNNIWSELGVGQDFASLPYTVVPIQVTSLNNVALLPKDPGTHSLAIVSSNPTVPFASADAKLTITAGPPSGFDLKELITLGAASNGVNPLTEDVTLQIGPYKVTFPAGSFRALPNSKFVLAGVISGVSLSAQFERVSANSFNFKVSALGVNLISVTNPVTVFVTIGDDSGTTTTIAKFN